MSIPDSPLLSLVHSVFDATVRFLECARTFILIDGHLFNPTS